MTRDPRFRPSAEEILENEWLKMNVGKPKVTKETLLDISSNLK